MGLFCTNLHLRTTDDKALSACLNRRGVTHYRATSAKRGWISLYEKQVSRQDEERIRDLASGLSKDLHIAAVAFLVHDSDIACYWLFDDGQLLDQYNSSPDYFEANPRSDGPSSLTGGRPEVLVRYCRKGVQQDELSTILTGEVLFAESVIERIAEALGIDPQRALADYRDNGDGQGPDGTHEADDEGDDEEGGYPHSAPLQTALAGRLAEMLGSDPHRLAADPQVTALVKAAAGDDTDTIDRLLGEGVDIDAEAPVPLPGGESMAALSQFLPGGPPKIAMTPLLAAILNKKRRAVERLLDAGADPNRVHPLFGGPAHAATSAGEVELLQQLIERGADVNARNAQGQTPLQVVEASRATRERLAQAQEMMRSMGFKLPGITDQLSSIALPTEGWDACERLLKTL